MNPDLQWEESQVDGAEESLSRVGEVLEGRYELVRKIGEGGMGEVYEARHRILGRRFAVKLLHPELVRSNRMLRRFSRESLSASRLEHEHVVAVLDCGHLPDGAPYFVMEFLRGQDLRTVLRETGQLSVPRSVRLMIQACRGLQAAHELGLVHRDLKPENLFIERRDGARECTKILDFGVVQTSGGNSTAHTGALVGTLRYMAPEQARGDARLDPRADLYALGAILYECLTGVVPHPGRNTEEVLFHIMTENPVPLRDFRSSLDPNLEATVLRSLRRNVEERFQSAAELAEALTPYADDATKRLSIAAHANEYTRADETLSNSPVTDSRPRPRSGDSATKLRLYWLAVGLFVGLALHFLDRARLLKTAVDTEKTGTPVTSRLPPNRMRNAPAPSAEPALPGSTKTPATARVSPVFAVASANPGVSARATMQTRKNVPRANASTQGTQVQLGDYGSNLDSQNPYGSAESAK